MMMDLCWRILFFSFSLELELELELEWHCSFEDYDTMSLGVRGSMGLNTFEF